MVNIIIGILIVIILILLTILVRWYENKPVVKCAQPTMCPPKPVCPAPPVCKPCDPCPVYTPNPIVIGLFKQIKNWSMKEVASKDESIFFVDDVNEADSILSFSQTRPDGVIVSSNAAKWKVIGDNTITINLGYTIATFTYLVGNFIIVSGMINDPGRVYVLQKK